jgi:hypothetical protein
MNPDNTVRASREYFRLAINRFSSKVQTYCAYETLPEIT